MGMFEKAASFRLQRKALGRTTPYPSAGCQGGGSWDRLGFRSLEDDVQTCCRQYFILSKADFARMRKGPQKINRIGWKWNGSTGTPLGELAAPIVAGQSRKLAGWPDFNRLLVTLDQGCAGRYGRLWERCPRCDGVSTPSYFTIYHLMWERASRTGVPCGDDWCCRFWGQPCPGKKATRPAREPSPPEVVSDSETSVVGLPTPSVSDHGGLEEEAPAPKRARISDIEIAPTQPSYADLES